MTAPKPDDAADPVSTTSEIRASAHFSRKVEDGGLLMCAVVFGLWMLTAVLRSAGYIVGPCKNLANGFPWEFVVSGGTFALPKVIGRATAGRVWEKLAGRS